jgi:hypothetical protein
MRILDSKTAKNSGLEAFHPVRLGISSMIEAQEVKEAVENQMGQMVVELQALFLGFPLNGFKGEGDIPQEWLKSRIFR